MDVGCPHTREEEQKDVSEVVHGKERQEKHVRRSLESES